MFTKIFVALFAATAVLAAPIESAEKRATYTGQATYYSPSVGTGACGWQNTDSELVVALNAPQWDSTANHGCGQMVTITNSQVSSAVYPPSIFPIADIIQQNGQQQQAKIVDMCPGCAEGSLDMSPTLFGALNNNDLDAGVFPISWDFASS
ncbi:hypothetical protein I315_04449 [Cryptococcus gattii Ru294]|uniref:Barwin domain-containing protein n=2 Tax=Cryptococcus gattii TaxID=37769 RepID=E6RFX5_CRYGW|nr:Hypothetical Protein CGB_N1150C [Cryptococcus gattii WM276]KIR52991.1 hypothetical protein I315_04449 [Cryptococcus gattii Ru294]KIR78150.1 hypothetical protein I306_04843 [Cryptococcus gattii EJB2]KIY32713.1 hypothetical protein I305_04871 [Cryptococcus gattii E566]KJE01894.1 hypothetical protein I311_04533 [Cryptococcus gattii NT-10]ADV25732.1 Hypothetical Protein CGB_N1150C [Cryptococcus gattii WM276]